MTEHEERFIGHVGVEGFTVVGTALVDGFACSAVEGDGEEIDGGKY